ncbi:hypothetical protein BKI52_35170 [marine bacterium AO1-C]|nr:hypothetical protein BKI52_35170 [marine bacterium AO1-C]
MFKKKPTKAVSRALLKKAVDHKSWDLLDKLLEIDATHINDNSYYTDTWGEWWGLLLECVRHNHVNGVKVLLKHGANKKVGNWGDCLPYTPLEYAQEHKLTEIIQLLSSHQSPTYTRQTEPELPELNDYDKKVNRQGEIRDDTGMVFQIPDDDD